jgi:hypothetical protein
VLRRLITAALLVAGASRGLSAQSGTSVEAPDLVLPTGARAMGMGQAAVATTTGTEALWWNPAALARARREVSFGFVSNVPIPAGDVSASLVIPVPRAFTIAIGLRYLNEGQQPAVDSSGVETGSFYQSSTALTATFAAPFGDRLSLGVNLKFFKVGFSCTGTCDLPPGTPLTGALDAGAQYAFTKDSLVLLGVAVRNVGLPLQFTDSPQADPLPGRLDVGLAVMPRLSQYPNTRLLIAGDVVTRLNGEGGPGFRIGGELSWLNQYFGRAGYVVEGPNGSGPTFGVGVIRGRWRADFAQFLSDLGGGAGTKPTYLTLRYVF